MLLYIFRRALFFIPTMLVVTLLAFALQQAAPGDPVLKICGEEVLMDPVEYDRCAAQHRLNLPSFYFSLKPASYPDTLHQILRRYQRDRLKNQLSLHGNWEPIAVYDQHLQTFEQALLRLPDSIQRSEQTLAVRREVSGLQTAFYPEAIITHLAQLDTLLLQHASTLSGLHTSLQRLNNSYHKILRTERPMLNFIPGFQWHGLDNQYHFWLSRLISGDLGLSYTDKRPVTNKIKDSIFWTLVLNGLSLFWAFLLAIPIGVYAALHKGKRFDSVSSTLLFVLYSLPRFWVATLLVVFFTTAEYGNWLHWFPSIGLGNLPPDAALWDRFWERAGHLILPVFCQTYALLAIIARQMRGGMLEILNEDYVRTARAKGLSEFRVVWVHAFRNALFPIITLFAGIFPAAIAGSVIIEFIFSIPGMGSLMYDSILRGDWPVLYAILVAGAFLTIVGILVADVLYALADPRVRIWKTKPATP